MTFNTFKPKSSTGAYGRMSLPGEGSAGSTGGSVAEQKQVETAAFIPPSQRELSGHDIAELKPKQINNSQLGLELYVPGAWEIIKNGRSIQLEDPATGCKLHINGFARADVSIEKWAGMRLPIVAKEKPHMSQVGSLSILKGENWGQRVQGVSMEYQGMLPGDAEASHMLVVCLRSDTMLIAMTIEASATAFKQQRAMYNWIISRTDLINTAALASDHVRKASEQTQVTALASQVEDEGEQVLGYIASGHRLMQLAIWGNIALAIWIRLTGIGDRNQIMLLLFKALLISAIGVYAATRMVKGFQWPLAGRIAALVLSCIPVVNIPVFWYVRRQARTRLAEQGYSTGIFGAAEAIPASNHDLRNVIIAAALASALAYGANSYFIRPPKDLPLTTFTPPDRRFTVSMPGVPVDGAVEDSDGSIIHPGSEMDGGHSYQLRTRKLLYAVSYYDLPVRPANVSETLDELRDDMAGQDSSALNEQTINLDGNVGRSLRLEEGKNVRLMHLYIVGKTVYLVEVSGPKSEEYSPKIQAYFASFHLMQGS